MTTVPPWTEIEADDDYKKLDPQSQKQMRARWETESQTSAPLAPPEPKDGAFFQGVENVKAAVKYDQQMVAGDTEGATRTLRESQEYAKAHPSSEASESLYGAYADAQDGKFWDPITKGVPAAFGEIGKDIDRDGIVSGLGQNLEAARTGIVKQIPNMALPMLGMAAGAATGAAVGSAAPIIGTGVGAAVGAWGGASAGNTAIEAISMAQHELLKAGVDLNDDDAVEAYLTENRASLLGKAAIKGTVIGAVDTVTLGATSKLLRAPVNAAVDRALVSLGVNLTDKVAVATAKRTYSKQIANAVKVDTAYLAAKSGLSNAARNTTAAAGEPVSEAAGDYLGQGLATGDYNSSDAFIEGLSSIGQGTVMFAGQKAYQKATDPLRALVKDPVVQAEDKRVRDAKQKNIALLREHYSAGELEHMRSDPEALNKIGLVPEDLTSLVKTNQYTLNEIERYEAMLRSAPSDAVKTGIRASEIGQTIEASRKTLLPTTTRKQRDKIAEIQRRLDENNAPDVVVGDPNDPGVIPEATTKKPVKAPKGSTVDESSDNDLLYDFIDQEQDAQDQADERGRKRAFQDMQEKPTDESVNEASLLPITDTKATVMPKSERAKRSEKKEKALAAALARDKAKTEAKEFDAQRKKDLFNMGAPVTEEVPVVEEAPVVEETPEPIVEETPIDEEPSVSEGMAALNGIEEKIASEKQQALDLRAMVTPQRPEGKSNRAGSIEKYLPYEDLRYVRNAHNVPMEERTTESLEYELSILNKKATHTDINKYNFSEGSILDAPGYKGDLDAGVRMAQVVQELMDRKVKSKVPINTDVYNMADHQTLLGQVAQPQAPVQPDNPGVTKKMADGINKIKAERFLSDLRIISNPDTKPGLASSKKKYLVNNGVLKVAADIASLPLSWRTEAMLELQIRVSEIYPSEGSKIDSSILQRYQEVKGHKRENVKVKVPKKAEPKQPVTKPKSEKPLKTAVKKAKVKAVKKKVVVEKEEPKTPKKPKSKKTVTKNKKKTSTSTLDKKETKLEQSKDKVLASQEARIVGLKSSITALTNEIKTLENGTLKTRLSVTLAKDKRSLKGYQKRHTNRLLKLENEQKVAEANKEALADSLLEEPEVGQSADEFYEEIYDESDEAIEAIKAQVEKSNQEFLAKEALKPKSADDIRVMIAMDQPLDDLTQEEINRVWAIDDREEGKYVVTRDTLTEKFNLDRSTGFPKPKAKFSKTSKTSKGTPIGTEKVKSTLDKLVGKNSVVSVVGTQEELSDILDKRGAQALNIDNQVTGAYLDGKIYLAADSIYSEDQILPLVIHEGGHWLRETDTEFQKSYSEFLEQALAIGKGKGGLKNLREQRAFQAAMRKAMTKDGTNYDLVQEEALMYFLQNEANVETTFYKKIISLVKRFLQKHFGMSAKRLNLSGYDMAQVLANDIKTKIKAAATERQERRDELDTRVPSGTEAKYMFLGERANSNTAAKMDLMEGKYMDLQGLTQEEIRTETGWFKTADKHWITELSDESSTIKPRFFNLRTGTSIELGKILDHPELYKAYPFLETFNVQIEEKGPKFKVDGAYSPSTFTILIDKYGHGIRKSLLHEIQHAIQHKEGLPSGGSSNKKSAKQYSKEAPTSLINELLNKGAEFHETRLKIAKQDLADYKRYEQIIASMSAEDKKQLDTFVTQKKSHNLDYAALMKWDLEGLTEHETFKLLMATTRGDSGIKDVILDHTYQLKRLANQSESYRRELAEELYAYQLYLSLHGEVLARDASRRASLSEEGRLAKAPDVMSKEDTSLVRYGKEEAYSQPEYDQSPSEMLARVFGSTENLSNEDFHTMLREDIDRAVNTATKYNSTINDPAAKLNPEFERGDRTQTTNMFTRFTSSPEYYSERDSAARRIVKHGADEEKLKFKWQTNIEGDFAEFASALTKTNPDAITKEATPYLIETDKTGKGFSLKHNNEIGDWTVLDRDEKAIGRVETRAQASALLIAEEQKYLEAEGMSLDALVFVERARELTSRSLAAQNADLMRQIDKANNAGLPEPTLGTTKLSNVIIQSGDLEGTYFPRVRTKGQYFARLEKSGEPNIVLTFDDRIPLNTLKGKLNNKVRTLINSTSTTGRQMAQLVKEGYEVTALDPVKTPPEELFNAPGITSAVDELVSTAIESVPESVYKKQLIQLTQLMLKNIGDIYKEKGNLSNRRSRSKNYTTGFETDAVKALVSHAQQVSAGISKRETAQNMISALTGHDLSYKEYLDKNPTGTFDTYRTEVAARKISPTTQKNLYADMRTYIDFVLKPTSKLGEKFGYAKALGVLMYLGFRPASAAVNMTNMVMGVPASIMAHTGISAVKAFKHITEASTKYAAYRSRQMALRGIAPGVLTEAKFQVESMAKGVAKTLSAPVELSQEDIDVFSDIHARGLDQAKFNMEAVRVIQGTIPKWFNSVMETSMYMFGATERANRAMTIFAAYQAHKANPKNSELTHDDLMDLAEHTSNRSHGLYGKATKPWLIQKFPLLDLPYTFMKFQHNYILNAIEMGVKYKNWKASTMAMMAPSLVAGLGATLGAPVIKTVAGAVMASLGMDGDDPEEALYKWAEENMGAFTARQFRHGLAGSVLGGNLKGSLAFNSPISSGKLSDLGGAPLSVWMDWLEGLDHLKYGEKLKAAEKLLPSGFGGSIAKAIRLYNEGYTTSTGSPKFFGEMTTKATFLEAIAIGLTFSPARLAATQEELWHDKTTRVSYSTERGNIMRRYKNYFKQPLEDRDIKALLKINKRVEKYNDRVSMSDPKYNVSYMTWPGIKKTLNQSMKPSKTDRMRRTN